MFPFLDDFLRIRCILSYTFKQDEDEKKNQYHVDDLARVYALREAGFTLLQIGKKLQQNIDQYDSTPVKEGVCVSKRGLMALFGLSGPVDSRAEDEDDVEYESTAESDGISSEQKETTKKEEKRERRKCVHFKWATQ